MQTVRNTDELRQALAAGLKPDQIEMVHPITQAQLDAAIATASATGKAAGIEEGRTSAAADLVVAERGRISAIQALARDGFDAEVKAAIEGGHTAEQFALALLTAANDRGITLDAIKKASPAPAAGTGTKAEVDPDAEASSLMVAAAREINKQSGRA